MSPSPTKSQPKYNVVENEGKRSSVTFFKGTKPYVANSSHPNFDEIIAACELGESDDFIIGLFDATEAVKKQFDAVSDMNINVTVKNGEVYLDGKKATGVVVDRIVQFHKQKLDFMPLARFLVKIKANPQPGSVESLFTWLERHRFTICADGDFLAYKGVRGAASEFRSQTSGHGVSVNGVKIPAGTVPNAPGSIVQMDRKDVVYDPSDGCNTGLHVGNFSYARSFVHGGVLMRVKVNPEHVVSVPRDSQFQKMRVCEYRVIQQVQNEDQDILFDGVFKTARVTGSGLLRITSSFAPVPAKVKGARKAGKGRAAGRKAPAKRAAVKEPKPTYPWPEFYEDFTKKDFDACTSVTELRWLAKQWALDDDVDTAKVEGGLSRASIEVLRPVLVAAARKRKRLLAAQGGTVVEVQ